MKTLQQLSMEWMARVVCNPNQIITVSGDYLVLYDIKQHKVIEHHKIDHITLK